MAATKLLQKTEVSGSSERFHSETGISATEIPGTTGTAGHHRKRWITVRPDCCTLLKRITGLKCVNSEVKSVDIHPKKGCLNWPYGTMSESP